ncbi:hemolysin family protein [Microbacterium sp. G2-8]|uniref:hemolysin family protein n=1 Tax=Microbacterium sp. G2-8 TaxID=2842454 RepID=UPI001C8AF0C2|nr:hemolysin family protein [Microbacterium sp. G2-8]
MIEALLIVGAVLLVAVAGFMTALDSALAVTSTGDLVEMATEGRSTRALAHLANDREAHDNAITLVRVMGEVGAVVMLSSAFAMIFQSELWGTLASAAIIAGVIYVVVASAPTTVGRRHARGILTFGAPTIHAARIVLSPIAQPLAWASARVIPGARRRGFESEEQLLSIVDEAASHALIEDDDRELIHSVFDFTDQIVRALMVPRTEMVTVDAHVTSAVAMDEFLSSGLSRLPVVDGDVDNVVGVLYLKDLVQHAFRDTPGWRTSPVRAFARPAVFVPEQMRAETLLQQMKADQVHVCLVVDEYGGIAGLVTLEDILEELVGEITDEYDSRSSEVVELPDGSYRVSSGLALDEVGDLFGIDIDDEDVDSIGGLMSKTLGHMPHPGEQAEIAGLILTGGTSRGRGRGIATVFVDRTEALRTVGEVLGRGPQTGDTRIPTPEEIERASEGEPLTTQTGGIRVIASQPFGSANRRSPHRNSRRGGQDD